MVEYLDFTDTGATGDVHDCISSTTIPSMWRGGAGALPLWHWIGWAEFENRQSSPPIWTNEGSEQGWFQRLKARAPEAGITRLSDSFNYAHRWWRTFWFRIS